MGGFRGGGGGGDGFLTGFLTRGGAPLCVGGVYPAAARARCMLASISSLVFVDFGIGTNGIFILVTGKGTDAFELGVLSGTAALGDIVEGKGTCGFPGIPFGGSCAFLICIGRGSTTAFVVDID